MKKSLLILFSIVILLTAAYGEERNTIPFKMSGSVMLVSVMIDGQQKTLVFDTGSEFTMIQDNKNVSQVVTLTLGTRNIDVRIGLQDFGRGSDLRAIHADGVLGEDILSKFSSVRIDYKAHLVELTK